jgi:hypothetical protein
MINSGQRNWLLAILHLKLAAWPQLPGRNCLGLIAQPQLPSLNCLGVNSLGKLSRAKGLTFFLKHLMIPLTHL